MVSPESAGPASLARTPVILCGHINANITTWLYRHCYLHISSSFNLSIVNKNQTWAPTLRNPTEFTTDYWTCQWY